MGDAITFCDSFYCEKIGIRMESVICIPQRSYKNEVHYQVLSYYVFP